MCDIDKIWPSYEDGSKVHVGDYIYFEKEDTVGLVTAISFTKNSFQKYVVDIDYECKGHWHCVYKTYEEKYVYKDVSEVPAYADVLALHNFKRPPMK